MPSSVSMIHLVRAQFSLMSLLKLWADWREMRPQRATPRFISCAISLRRSSHNTKQAQPVALIYTGTRITVPSSWFPRSLGWVKMVNESCLISQIRRSKSKVPNRRWKSPSRRRALTTNKVRGLSHFSKIRYPSAWLPSWRRRNPNWSGLFSRVTSTKPTHLAIQLRNLSTIQAKQRSLSRTWRARSECWTKESTRLTLRIRKSQAQWITAQVLRTSIKEPSGRKQQYPWKTAREVRRPGSSKPCSAMP